MKTWIGRRTDGREVATLDDIAAEVHQIAAERAAAEEQARLDRLRGGPCAYCGLGITIDGRGWHKSPTGSICGRCWRWFEDFDGDRRDLCAAALVGIATRTRRSSPRELAGRVGLVLWSESGRTEPNDRPWQHVVVEEMRKKFADEAQRGRYSMPPRWAIDEVVSW